MRALAGSALVAASLVGAVPAFAEDTQEIAAEKLFDEGHALLGQHRWAEACDKLAASEALAPAGGTELNLGECFDKLGKTASAWGAYRKAAARARAAHATAAEAIANQRAAALEPKLRRVVVRVTSPADDLAVRVDDTWVARDAWGEGLPVDPGTHTVTAKRPGFVSFTWSGSVESADTTVTVPDLRPEAVAAPVTPAGWQRPLGVALAATGVVAAGVGLALGARAIGLNGDAEDACPIPALCMSPAALDAAASARDFALASTILVVSGLALAVTGLVIFVVAPRESRTGSMVLAPALGGAVFGGTF